MVKEVLVMDTEELARFMHDKYEEQAKIIGWKTQESCKVEYHELPEKNKATMYAVALHVIGYFQERLNLSKDDYDADAHSKAYP